VTEYSDDTWNELHKKYRGKHGETLLHLCAEKGETEMMKLFLRISVNVNILNKSKETPLHIACFNGHTECVKLLLEANANK
jgi:ankyrin repeat protein